MSNQLPALRKDLGDAEMLQCCINVNSLKDALTALQTLTTKIMEIYRVKNGVPKPVTQAKAKAKGKGSAKPKAVA